MKKSKLEARVSEIDKYRFHKKANEENLAPSTLLRKIVSEYLGDAQSDIHVVRIDNTEKENKIAIRVSNEEYLRIAKLSQEANLSMSDYIRKKSLGEKIIVVDGLKEFVFQLRKIGNNVNQLTNLANEGRIFSPDLSATKQYLEELWKELRVFVERAKG